MSYAQATAVIATPIGPVRIESDGALITAIRIGADRPVQDGVGPALREATAQLRAYFGGRLTRFDLPLKPANTPRGGDLRHALQSVGFGRITTYGALADALGSSARAVGQACRTNPFPIVVPCHRILSAGPVLGHYSAGDGIGTKAFLLQHEQAKGWRA